VSHTINGKNLQRIACLNQRRASTAKKASLAGVPLDGCNDQEDVVPLNREEDWPRRHPVRRGRQPHGRRHPARPRARPASPASSSTGTTGSRGRGGGDTASPDGDIGLPAPDVEVAALTRRGSWVNHGPMRRRGRATASPSGSLPAHGNTSR
jgi:hypothetical protein